MEGLLAVAAGVDLRAADVEEDHAEAAEGEEEPKGTTPDYGVANTLSSTKLKNGRNISAQGPSWTTG